MNHKLKKTKVTKTKTVTEQMVEVKKSIKTPMMINFLFSASIETGVELKTDENAPRHEENRITATTKDHDMRRKLDVKQMTNSSIEKKIVSFSSLNFFRLSKMIWF